MSPLRTAFRCVSPAGRRGRLSIFIFHRVLATPDPLFPDEPDVARFASMLQWIKTWFNVVPLDRAVVQLSARTLPERAAAITFDDGYADNATVAMPLLLDQNMRATFFIATGFLDGGRMWNDTIIEAMRDCTRPTLDLTDIGLGVHRLGTNPERRAAIDACIAKLKYLQGTERASMAENISTIAGASPPSNLMMSSQQVRQLHRAGMQIGAHTMTHPILTQLPPDEAKTEIEGSKARLESIIDHPVGLFAYPNGKQGDDFDDIHAGIARSIGFDAAVTTDRGTAHAESDLMQLPRFTPWDRHRLRFGMRLLSNLVSPSPTRSPMHA